MIDINLKNVFSDIPPMASDRLILRRMKETDADDMFEYASAEETTRFLLWQPHKTKRFTKNYLKFIQKQYKSGEFYDWAVTLKDSGKMIGTCGFTNINSENMRAEIGYVINPKYHGFGYATEAAMLVVRFAFEQLDIHRLEAKFIVGNDASENVMRKLGMKKEGIMREYMFIKGDFRDICMYSMLAEDYFRQRYNI